MHWRIAFVFLTTVITLPAHAQNESVPEPGAPTLAFKLLARSTQPFFTPGEPLKLEVACVSVAEIASAEWQERWNNSCSNVELEVEEARSGGYWGGVGLIAWLQNRLHVCLLPEGESYGEKGHFTYTRPKWQPVTVSSERLSGLRGMLQINARAILKNGEKELDQESAEVVTAIVSDADNDAIGRFSPDIQRDAGAIQSGNSERSKQLANELLDSPTKGALRLAVRVFDNTERTSLFWTVIENSPHQQTALDLMLSRLREADFVPDYNLLVSLTGMKARLDKPLEFDASDRQPYSEYHPDLEDSSVSYFRTLLSLLVESSGDPRSARARAIVEIAASLTESHRCPLGTYGLSSNEAAMIESKLTPR